MEDKSSSFIVILDSVVASDKISASDKIVFGVLFGFRLQNKIWASNEYVSKRTALSIPTVNRSIKSLEKNGFLSRVTKYGKLGRERVIEIPGIEDFEPSDQNDHRLSTSDQNDHNPLIKMIRASDQNDPIIYKNNKKKNKKVYTPTTEILETNNDLQPQTQASFLPPVEKPKPERKLYSSDYYESEYVLLTDVQLGKLRAYYEHHTPQDPERYLAKSISVLDKWFSENPKGLKKSKDHYRALIDWPQEKALTFYKLEMENKRIRSY